MYDAAVAAEQAIRVDPEDRGGHLMLGETALDAGELAHAEAAFRRVLELDAADPDGREGLAEVLAARGPDTEPASSEDGRPGTDTGATPSPRRSRTARRMPRRTSGRRERLRIDALVGVGGLVVGLAVGIAAPAVGVVRGVVAGTAVALMWIAVRPLRSSRASRPAAAIGGIGEPLAPEERPETEDDEAVAPPDVAHVQTSLARELAAGGEDDDHRDVAVDDHRVADATAPSVDWTPETSRARRELGPPAIDELPDTIDELVELSRVGLASADVELAHAAASRLEAVAPGSVEAHRALGAVALAEQDYAQARLHYRRVLELEPLDQEAHERLALVGERLAERIGKGLGRRARSRFPLRGFRSR